MSKRNFSSFNTINVNKKFFTLLFLLLASSLIFTQNQTYKCGFDINLNKSTQKNKIIEFESSMLWALKNNDILTYRNSSILKIPIVVHIIHEPIDSIIGYGTNISDTLVDQAINELNNAFRNTGIYDSLSGVDVEIEFELAKRDTCGNSTIGINRIASNSDLDFIAADGDNLATNVSWNPYEYLNIYVWNSIYNFPGYGVIGGYAHFPSWHGDKSDGIHINKETFTYYHGGITAHEVGHYLGLHHTFAGGCKNEDCQTDGDKVCDTPPDNNDDWFTSCSPVNSCYSDTSDTSINNPFRSLSLGGLGDQNDPINNYMDYTGTTCKNQFTDGQKTRMRNSLLTARKSLLTSNGLTPPCDSTICPSYSLTQTLISNGLFVEGDTIFFINNTTGSFYYEWHIDSVLYSSSYDTIWIPSQEGEYLIRLCAFNIDSTCSQCTSKSIVIDCSVKSSFSANNTNVFISDSIDFTNNSIFYNNQTTAVTYAWYLDNALISTDSNMSHTFNNSGDFTIKLVACNSVCCDSSTEVIYVACNDSIDITPMTNTYINSGDSVFLSNTSLHASSFKWYVNNILVDTTFDFQYVFDQTGAHWVKLIGDNGYCLDSALNLVQVKACNNLEAANWVFPNNNWLILKDSLSIEEGSVLTGNSSTSISDVEGNLLLYSNGKIIYNRYHQNIGSIAYTEARPNGNMIIRKPGSGSLYYCIGIINGPMRASLIDISKDRGNGIVVNSSYVGATRSTFTAVDHCNNNDIWIISKSYNTNEYFAELLTDSGLTNQPIISSFSQMDSVNFVIDCIKASVNGNYVAHSGGLYSKGIHLMDFDNNTGILTNYRLIDSTAGFHKGVEFSPSEQYIYSAPSEQGMTQLYQYDISSGNAAAITNSKYIIDSLLPSFDDIQLGLDQNIYITETWYNDITSISKIDNPDSVGVKCDYIENIQYLMNTNKTLPNLNQSLYKIIEEQLIVSTKDSNVCYNDVTFIKIDKNACSEGALNYILPQGATISQVVDSGIYVSFSILGINNVIVELQSVCDSITDSINITTDICTGYGMIDSFNLVKIYPNPSELTFNIEFTDNSSKNIYLFDINSRLILKHENISNNKMTLNTKDTPPGVYCLKIVSNQMSKIFKLVKK